MYKKNRKTIRLQGYDYAQDGWYFITLCIQNFEEILGEIAPNGEFIPNHLGEIVEKSWLETSKIRPNTNLDVYQVMPNHFHAIITIGNSENPPSVIGFPDTHHPLTPFKSPSRTLEAIIRGFKGQSTKRIKEYTKDTFDQIWQRNYYERIIRDANELEKIRNYILDNPKKWKDDKDFFKKLLKKMTHG